MAWQITLKATHGGVLDEARIEAGLNVSVSDHATAPRRRGHHGVRASEGDALHFEWLGGDD